MMTHTFGRTKSSLLKKNGNLYLYFSYSANRRSLEWDNSTAVVDLILTMSPVQSPKKDLLFGWSKSPSWEGKWQSGGALLGILKGRVNDLIASHKIVQIETFGSRDVKRFRFFWGGKVFWVLQYVSLFASCCERDWMAEWHRMTMFYFHTMFTFQEPAHYLPLWRASCRSLLPQQGCTQNAEGLVLPTRCRFGWFDDVGLGTSKTQLAVQPKVHNCLCLKNFEAPESLWKIFVLFPEESHWICAYVPVFAPSLLI